MAGSIVIAGQPLNEAAENRATGRARTATGQSRELFRGVVQAVGLRRGQRESAKTRRGRSQTRTRRNLVGAGHLCEASAARTLADQIQKLLDTGEVLAHHLLAVQSARVGGDAGIVDKRHRGRRRSDAQSKGQRTCGR